MITITRPSWTRDIWGWDPWRELDRLHREVSGIFGLPRLRRLAAYPPMNVHTADDDVVVTSELPGVDPSEVEITVSGDTLSIKGSRKPRELKEGEQWHRRERGFGEFFRTVQLPFTVDASKVSAEYTNGVLKIVLPRSEADKPRKIAVKSTN
ncbi:MAG TPA: Hsp20/alpha crystallin family protein [Deltaproteobacteria bacterium]|nr:Hsp20/alpha crystallin family protein [Deltaproteobacteria bacterium]HOM27940.1 Hsp20/alpha crystallin family protein [Deltaproteobacteria bacterium]HPP80940.1 Hsp20/alpha crystallin family protein [Deltaproteobacteria bacterium]